MVEFPQYVLKSNSAAMLFPKILQMFLLSLLFYVGLKINFIVLDLDVKAYYDVMIILGLLVLSIAQVTITKKKQTNMQYNFYSNRIEKTGFEPKTELFADVKNIALKKTVFDRIFNTGSIKIDPDFDIISVSNANQVFAYTQRLVQAYRYSMYSQYYQQPQQQQ